MKPGSRFRSGLKVIKPYFYFSKHMLCPQSIKSINALQEMHLTQLRSAAQESKAAESRHHPRTPQTRYECCITSSE
ncbi:hypothetical protein DSO57_1035153 [Entomophthora muscae]|uniref:Uncharacterized protein n=1 Tax=Entomophthora muscae TaxID=34485 RepID=A0ACC2SZP5_9FUNG|nr:hypothetical protein DSO57_1035153 [Entomophthora muscae]